MKTKKKIVENLVFPDTLYGCESWTVSKLNRKKIDAFELWCWRRMLRIPWTARRRNSSVLEEVGRLLSLESEMLQLRLKFFGHIIRADNSLEKGIMEGKTEGKRKRGRHRQRWMNDIKNYTKMPLSQLWFPVQDRGTGGTWLKRSPEVDGDLMLHR